MCRNKRFNGFLGMMVLLATASFAVILMWSIFEGSASASSKEESPAPASVDEIVTPMEKHSAKKEKLPLFSEKLKEKVKDLPPFFRDMSFAIKPRTYFFYESKPNSNPPPEKNISEAWALGGSLAYESGLWLDRFAVGAELFTSQRLYGPEDRDGTKLLAPGQQGYTVVGQLYGKLKLLDDVRGKSWQLVDAFSGDVYERNGEEMQEQGFYVDLPGWGYHFLQFKRG